MSTSRGRGDRRRRGAAGPRARLTGGETSGDAVDGPNIAPDEQPAGAGERPRPERPAIDDVAEAAAGGAESAAGAASDREAPADTGPDAQPIGDTGPDPQSIGDTEPAESAAGAASDREAPADTGSDAQPVDDAGPADALAHHPAGEPVPGTDLPLSAQRRPARPVQDRRGRSARAGAVVALLCGILGFALAAQLHSNNAESQFANARQSDLVRILDELNSREERLRSEISDLEFRRQTINSKAQGSEAALVDAQRRATDLGILAGTVRAEGPGLVVTFTERGKQLAADRILDAVEELRGAGAEALQIQGANGDAVRISASSYFVDHGAGIQVDGKSLLAPYTVTVIGEPATMDSALRIPGGVVETVRNDGGSTDIEQRRTVQVTAIRALSPPEFARPAP